MLGMDVVTLPSSAAAVLLCMLALYLLVQAWVLQRSFDRECDSASVARGFNVCSFVAGLGIGIYAVWALVMQQGRAG